MYIETTNGIEVMVLPFFVPEQSDSSAGHYLFGYHVTITNRSDCEAKLISRHWIITDGHNQTEEVQGDGVVGLQPLLQPGASFEYTSACPLKTPTGNMRGTYHMIDGQGHPLTVKIPLFLLRQPDLLH